ALRWPDLNAAPGPGEIAVAGHVVESRGTVHLRGQTWSAAWPAGTVQPGQRVRVVERKGLILVVEPLDECPPPVE
ncbi:MAG: NfeD family protein, partial [Chloroflexota bacterium]